MYSSGKLLLSALLVLPLLSYAQEPSASSPTTSTDSSAQATVYFYRYRQFAGSALSPSVYCDEIQLARMANGRFFAAHLPPGKHSFRSNDSQSGVELEIKGGEKYFIRVEIATGMMKGHGRLVLTPAEQGGYELKAKQLKPLDADKISDKDRVSLQDPQ